MMDSIGPDARIWHYDGKTALRHLPRVDWDEHGLMLDWGTERSGPHRWRSIEALTGADGEALFGLKGKIGWRLAFAMPLPPALEAHLPLPGRYGRLIDDHGLWRTVIAAGLLAAGVIALAMQLPGWIAPHVPRSWEAMLGDAMVGDFGGRLCETPESRAALDRLSAALADGTQLRQVAIADIDINNAITLPGGRILIFRGFIDEAKSADELAGVLAHEIGHVRHRDTVTALVRQLGLSTLLGGLDGYAAAALNGALAMSYSREAESAADTFAIQALRGANISPLPTAHFFEGLSDKRGGDTAGRAMVWLASHPAPADREHAFEQSLLADHEYRAALSASEWAALRTACGPAEDEDEDEAESDKISVAPSPRAL